MIIFLLKEKSGEIPVNMHGVEYSTFGVFTLKLGMIISSYLMAGKYFCVSK